MNLVRRSGSGVLVLPEGVAGVWQPVMEQRWAPLSSRLRDEQRALLVGATLERTDGKWHAAAVLLGAARGVYRQRVPLPFAMWRPWGTDHFPANFAAPGTLDVGRRKIGVLVCWEIGSAWAALSSMAQGADVLVGLANTAWLRHTSAAQAQRQALASWGALFNVPTVFAVNE